MECVAIVNHKCVIYWVINYRTMKYVLEKHDGWHGAMVWPHLPWLKAENVWFMSSCTPFINRTITEEVQCFREGNHPDWRGIQISVLVCHSVFFQRSTYRLKWNVFKFDIFPNSFTIFRGLCAFLGINYAHNSNSNNRCMKRCTRTVWKTMLVLYKKWNKCLKTWCLAWCHGMTSPCPGKNLRRFGLCRHARPS